MNLPLESFTAHPNENERDGRFPLALLLETAHKKMHPNPNRLKQTVLSWTHLLANFYAGVASEAQSNTGYRDIRRGHEDHVLSGVPHVVFLGISFQGNCAGQSRRGRGKTPDVMDANTPESSVVVEDIPTTPTNASGGIANHEAKFLKG
ncbi:hypothetical protein PAAG_07907 [Paracoccidioides lutzii Pb01]|uniref:Uncharacterized protein n=1 Tax=Paracoccidioides lutzii (strain ATCC MYA-826 / Pb01) TaxID=502779 RepID=C1HAS8_PARBA|nr:hypothetical protein PAAG_07907 [Paracoccidioides lutzii Pb01]EEH37489.1 hypothetical protein PAAG_07907 [Paracoccidioides lutzii Pb01]